MMPLIAIVVAFSLANALTLLCACRLCSLAGIEGADTQS